MSNESSRSVLLTSMNWLVTALAATAVLQAPTVSSFSPLSPAVRRPLSVTTGRQNANNLASPLPVLSERFSTQLCVVADPETLLGLDVDMSSARRNKRRTSKQTLKSTPKQRPLKRTPKQQTLKPMSSKPVEQEEVVEEVVVDNNDPQKTTFSSKSSTVPGFRERRKTYKEQKLIDGMKMVARNSGNHIEIGKKENKNRKADANLKMYRNCASVPDSLIQFSREIHSHDRITPTEEIELGGKIQEALRLLELHSRLEEKLNREPSAEEWCAAAGKLNLEALRQTIEEGGEARENLVTANLRMVQGMVNLYIRNGLGSEYNAGDLMQEGTLALIHAAEKFNPDKGFRFSTYAMYWIRAAMKRSQILQSRIIYVPQKLHESHKRIEKCKKELKRTLRREPTKQELMEAAKITGAQYDRILKAMDQKCYSLDAKIREKKLSAENTRRTYYDLVDKRATLANKKKRRGAEFKSALLRDDLISAMRKYLDPLDVDILLLRYGMMEKERLPEGMNNGPCTIAQVGEVVGWRPDKVRRRIIKNQQRLKFAIANEWANVAP